MNILRTALAALLAVPPGLAAAQGFAGAEVSAEILGFAEDPDLGETRYSGGAEFDLFGGLSVEADLAYHGFRGFDSDGRNATLHAIYGFGQATDLGLFYGNDDFDGSTGILGIEGATTVRGFDLDAALGSYDGDAASGGMASIGLSYDFGSFAATGFAGTLSGDIEASRVSVGGAYRLGRGPTLFAEVGRIGVEGETDTFVSLGARVAIGPNGGTTFGNRGLFEIVPGLQAPPLPETPVEPPIEP